ncbi:glycosyltransferase family 2 protein [Luteolibacter flavescens]|uniref:Glycosyltransferase family 2 protein n=1 Tax=Luteolibacter flavescens TaxID=1859460 RepID=A0ABT3FNK6_9BACT|nr:glycosyltransferase family 2 protein [Luteolibacter flavescens]MCW1885161.1 glycosyltransferase family 2 protein [Luteolibacter flavescens]
MSEPETRGDDERAPRYRIAWQRPRRHRQAICVFVINEGEKIRKQLRAMKEHADIIDLIVADGGSTDGSLDAGIMEEAGATALLVKTGPGKLSAQMRMAMDHCMNEGYEGIVVIDGNGKDGLDAIPSFVAALEDGWDHVQGSRFIPGGHHENTPLSRLLAVRLLHAPMISLASGFRYTDTTNGFRAYSRKLLTDPRVSVFRPCFDRYQLHYHLAIESVRRGFRVKELPVSRVYPASGKTPTKIRGFGGLVAVLRQLLDVCLGKYRAAGH